MSSLSPIYFYSLLALIALTFLALAIFLIVRFVKRRHMAQVLYGYERELAHAFNTPIVTERSIVELSWMRNRLGLTSEMVETLHQRYLLDWEAKFVIPDSVTGEEREIARRLRRELGIKKPYGEGYGRFY